jgi:hypothetical protein
VSYLYAVRVDSLEPMGSVRLRPGPLSTRAFNLGAVAAAVLACTVAGISVWYGVVGPLEAVVLSAVVVPPYLLLVACGLGVWLGFGRDARATGRATRRRL